MGIEDVRILGKEEMRGFMRIVGDIIWRKMKRSGS